MQSFPRSTNTFIPVVRDVVNFVNQIGRTSMLGTTFTYVLLGVASVTAREGAGLVALVLAASFAFHVAVYAANDVVDLRVDRADPRRATSPLVRGVVTPAAVLAFAGVAALAALALAATAGLDALAWMMVAVVLLGVYDLYGKRTSLPPATDLAQGIGWAALVAFAAVAAGQPGSLTVWVAVYIALAVVLVNGVHGGLRDVRSDLAGGAHTTAIMLGVRPARPGGTRITARLTAYALLVQGGMAVVIIGGLIDEGSPALAIGVAGAAASVALLIYGLSVAASPARSWPAALAHVMLIVAVPVVLVAHRVDPLLLVLFVVLFVVPWASVQRPLTRARAAISSEQS